MFLNKGPITGLKKLQNDSKLQDVVKMFTESTVISPDNIAAADEITYTKYIYFHLSNI